MINLAKKNFNLPAIVLSIAKLCERNANAVFALELAAFVTVWWFIG